MDCGAQEPLIVAIKGRDSNTAEWQMAQFLAWVADRSKKYEGQESTDGETEPFIFAKSTKKGSLNGLWSIFSSAAASKYFPTRYEILTGKFLSKSTVFGIRDTGLGKGGWVIRVDNPHGKVNFNHLNINPKVTGVRDPHVRLPPGAAAAGEAATKILSAAGKVALVAGVVVDTVRVGSAANEDYKRTDSVLGHNTAKTTASVASGWGGGIAGAFAGNSAGATIGGAIGALFGGVGAVPGAAIGSIVGCVLGGVTGGIGASLAAERLVNQISEMRGIVEVLDCGLKVTASFDPEIEKHENEWKALMLLVAILAMERRKASIVSQQRFEEIFSTAVYGNLANSVSALAELEVADIEMDSQILEEICKTPQFFFSTLAIAVDPIYSDIEMLMGCKGDDIPRNLACEYLCMNSDGSALYWLNPKGGAEAALKNFSRISHFKIKEKMNTKK